MHYYFAVFSKFADFNGRARRSEYWYFVLFNTIASYLLMFISISINAPILHTLYVLATIIPSIAVGIRRMHDVGKSGWYILIPIYNLILAVTEGQQGDNEYGPDPKAEEMAFQDTGLLDDTI